MLSTLLGWNTDTGSRNLATWYQGGHPMSETPGVLWSMGTATQSGQVISETAAMNISAVYAAVRILSQAFACLPLAVLRETGGKHEHAKMHPAYTVLRVKPNREMIPKRFWELMQVHKLLWGNAYAEIQWTGGGNVAAIWPLEPWRVEPKRDDDGRLYFLVDSKRKIFDEDILRMPNLSDDGIVGKSVVTYARESLGLTQAANLYGASFFGAGGIPSGVLEHPGRLDPQAREEVKRAWNESHSPVTGGRNQTTAVLWEGMKYTKVGIQPEDAQFLETRQFQVAEIARWFGVPPHMLQDLTRSTYSNIEHQQIEFVMYSLMPHLVEWEQEINRKLLNPPNLYAKFNVRGLMRGDMASQAAFMKELNFIGVYTVNEIKELLDENTVGTEGDVRVVQSAMVPLKDLTKPKPPPVAPIPPAVGGDGAGEDQDEGDDEADDGQEQGDETDSRMAAMREAATLMVRSSLERMQRREIAAMHKAAERPGSFMVYVEDEFFPKFRAHLRESVESPLASLLALDGKGGLSVNVAEVYSIRHVERSRQDILRAMEVSPAEFKASIEACCTKWLCDRDMLEELRGVIDEIS